MRGCRWPLVESRAGNRATSVEETQENQDSVMTEVNSGLEPPSSLG